MTLYKRNKLIFGVGINNADYGVYKTAVVDGKRKNVWTCPFYQAWTSMLRRCYSDIMHPTYKDCSVCDEWLTFSNFKAWMEQQDWQGKQLDKDLLKEGNKRYCTEYCIFVDRKINSFVIDCGASRGEYMIGVSWFKPNGKFRARCSNPFTGKKEYLGLFTTELEAHLTWRTRKHELSCLLADSEYCTDERLANVLRTRYDVSTDWTKT